ncbi:MAG: cupin domain-containing protein [Gammaproteobacteria bacterium]|nr:cupin domain-containing protein [Gammaproteobacteria bacterium]NIR90638.1 cupin domain-containing protein [Gammaproteobacteria bacterium]NIU07018.1 cupin domain-containing protein [Gammaproteobacteria bacterium]NIV53928.1 cupin domain-containing protein [Gammaproteobacteria bacterium]NIW86158.1 cupin domain-containing protein [Gammaproteobacteria bacterium]
MPDDIKVKNAVIRRGASVLWENPPNHYDALSKMLVRPENTATRRFDFRISIYQPKGYVAPHHHQVQEQIYHIQSGEGVMELEGERHVVRPQDTVFIPPGLEHAIYNTGLVDLVFYVITSPPEDE